MADRMDSNLVQQSNKWRDEAPWLIVLRAFRVSIGIQALLVAGMCAVFVSAGWSLSAKCFVASDALESNPETVLATDHRFLSKWPGERQPPVFPTTPFLNSHSGTARSLAAAPANPMLAMPVRMILPAARIFDRTLSMGPFFYYLSGGLWTLLVWSVGGTAIARMAVVKIGRERRIDMTTALRFAQQKFPSAIGATLMPLFGVLILTIPIAALGVAMRIGLGAFLAGLLWPLVILAGAMMTMMLLGILVGWPLVNVALATEGTDAFDSVSRAYAYSFQRPWRYLAYTLLAAAAGLMGWLVVWGFSESVIAMGYWSATWGMGREQVGSLADSGAELGGLTWVGAQLIRFWTGLARTMASGYGYTYFWCGMSCIYLLLRHDVDSTEWDQVYDPNRQDGIVYGLPASPSTTTVPSNGDPVSAPTAGPASA